MAYQEVISPAAPADIVDAIRSFASANGWTVMRNNLVATVRTVTLKRAETDYVHLYNDAANVYVLCSIDYNGATPPTSQTKRSNPIYANVGAGPYTKMFLFADAAASPHVHVVIETAISGIYRHMSFGRLALIEEFTGGTYYDALYWANSGSSQAPGYGNSAKHAMFGYDEPTFTGTYWSGFRCDFAADARTDQWFRIAKNATAATDPFAYCGIDGTAGTEIRYMVENCDDNNFSNRSMLYPTDVRVNRLGGYYSRVGSHPNVRICSVFKYSPGQEITIAGDVWKVFPFCRKFNTSLNVSNPVYEAHSGYLGYAYKKVT